MLPEQEILRNITEQIKQKALALGFADCGMAQATILNEEEVRLQSWVEKGYFGKMKYYGTHIQNRIDPAQTFANAKSVIGVVLPYYQTQKNQTGVKIARYALGKDYHVVIKEMLHQLLDFIKEIYPEADGKVFCDSGAMLEKAWAKQCGLGGIGKNSLLIHPKWGSFVFIGLILLDKDLIYDVPFSRNLCENCQRCINACPTGAIVSPYDVDVNKCISYHTIESKEKIPIDFIGKTKGYVFGCDICQDACPHNHNLVPNIENSILYKESISNLNSLDLVNLKEAQFDLLFSDTAIARTGFQKLKENIEFNKQ